jgi:hypothetical protein
MPIFPFRGPIGVTVQLDPTAFEFGSVDARSCAQSPGEETKMRTCRMGTGDIVTWRRADKHMLPPL